MQSINILNENLVKKEVLCSRLFNINCVQLLVQSDAIESGLPAVFIVGRLYCCCKPRYCYEESLGSRQPNPFLEHYTALSQSVPRDGLFVCYDRNCRLFINEKQKSERDYGKEHPRNFFSTNWMPRLYNRVYNSF